MKNFGLKITALIFCLPALAYGAPRLTGATRATLVKGATTAQIKTALTESGVVGVDAGQLLKALDNDIIEASQLARIMDNPDGKIEDSVVKGILTLVAAEADSTKMEALPGSKVKLKEARKKLVSLAVEVEGGSSHNQSSINDISAAITDGYKSASAMPSETVVALEAALEKTATEEARTEAKRTGKSLLELFSNCK